MGFFPDRTSTSWPQVRAGGQFCVNVLAEDPREFCRRFAARGDDKFESTSHRLSDRGIPVLDGVVARIESAIAEEFEAGDHVIVLARGQSPAVERRVGPLLSCKGAYARFAPAG